MYLLPDASSFVQFHFMYLFYFFPCPPILGMFVLIEWAHVPQRFKIYIQFVSMSINNY